MLFAALMLMLFLSVGDSAMADPQKSVDLPSPRLQGGDALEDALQRRRSVRDFSKQALTLDQVGQLLWAAQGETDESGLRASPSAGALYPLELYLFAGSVGELEPGIYHYEVGAHRLSRVASGDRRRELARAALGQSAVSEAAAVIAVGALYSRTTGKYGNRGRRYVHMEAGHAAQNVLLQATAMGLDAVPIGAFDDSDVARAASMPRGTQALYLLPVGHGAIKR